MSRDTIHTVATHEAAPDANLLQQAASRPESLVWVSASAGSGKTKVLTDRVLRLLLPDPAERWDGTPPHRLLCITYTKAAAAEMALRVNSQLGKWAVLEESRLAEELASLTGMTARPHLIAAARKLFAEVLDCPGGLKIMTIHAFCQSVLGRFPLEAGVNPGFTVLDDKVADEILSQVLASILTQAQFEQNGDLAQAFRRLAITLQLDDLIRTLRSVLDTPEGIGSFMKDGQDLATLEGNIQEALGLNRDVTLDQLRMAFVENTPEAEIRHLAQVSAKDSLKTINIIGGKLSSWLELAEQERPYNIDLYQSAFLTDKYTPRKLNKFSDREPNLAALFARESDRLLTFRENVAIVRQSQATSALLTLSQAVLRGYEEEKRHRDGLDYQDLILKTDDLLKKTSGEWVHFKLDGGIDHILMDESQDTNPHQWSILERLSSEVFSGNAREAQSPRSLFVVGDKKQSIFSFQGASPESFDEMQEFFAEKARLAKRDFERIPMEISFRSASPILDVVDQVFSTPDLREQIGLDPATSLKHFSFHKNNGGLVELWPVIEPAPKIKSDEWQLPFSPEEDKASQESLAERIASEISGWLQKGERIESQGRAMMAGDILILVRTRTSLVQDLVRQLKRRNLPVSGIDRLKLSEQIAVQDLLALARFVRLTGDEFSLACVLKSPLVSMSEDELMKLALTRTETLWDTLRSQNNTALINWLEGLIALGRTAQPFEFLEAILNRPCPADPQGTGWRAMTARLGQDVIDPLEELASLCLKLESQGIMTLEDVILWQQSTDIEIKREMEEAGSQIRIMTVHAAKGLEAPVVILPDTLSVPTRKTLNKFLWPDKSGLPVPLWAASSDTYCRAYDLALDEQLTAQKAESARLLYVALTRARDRLYIMGAGNKGQTLTWYDMVSEAFDHLSGVETIAHERRRFSKAQTGPAKDLTGATITPQTLTPVPEWLSQSPVPEALPPRPFSPSRLDGELLSGSAPRPIDAAHPDRFKRGNITHKLFQFLPELPVHRREQAAYYYVSRAGRDLAASVQASIIKETLAVLGHPDFAPVFGAGSLAEVPIAGILPDGREISGQIDRLIIAHNDILIVDYKTNRPSPETEADIPQIYLDQMRAYRDTLAQIYPKSLIKCALLWTDQPLLMPVPI